jgi:dolichol-phosphate mannosyltransferase
VINENGKLHKQLAHMQSLFSGIDTLIADGGSTDGSTDEAVLRDHGVNALLVKTGDGKLGAQMRMAFAWALNRGYKGIVAIDGNNKDSVENIPDFIAKLEQGYDHIQGSRFISGGHHENTPVFRLAGVKLLHAPLISLASGFHYTDTTNGFRAYSARLLTAPEVAVFRDEFTGYELHYYLAIRAARLGYRCIEIPVTRRYPAVGKIPTKITTFRGNITVIIKLLQAAGGRFNP